jgi:Xaa-Pro aminopeptidase
MKSDLDRLMMERDLAAIVIAVDHNYSPALDYLAGNIHITNGLAMKPRGGEPTLFVNPMEIDEAAASGLPVYTFNDVGWNEMLQQADFNRTVAEVVFWKRCLEQIGVESGKVGVYGVSDLNLILALFPLLQAAHPQYEFIGETAPTLFDVAALTKDADELARIKTVAKKTSEVLDATWNYISACRANSDTVVKDNGEPLTINDVKRFIRRQLLDRELEDTGMIFAQGRDAGVPHSRGQSDAPLKLGQTIVFDLFPREYGGGYYHDTTRTWCIGYASDDIRKTYETVMNAFYIAIETYGLGKPAHLVQEAVLDYFEGEGHATSRSQPDTTSGYVHGLGHGIGLNIHENPRMSHLSKEDVFQVGNVITIEPGIYYPDKGYGVRIEDACYVAEDGSLVTLTDFHKELVLPLRST